MVILYDSMETNFNSNGICVLDPIVKSCKIIEELNGQYFLDLELIKDDKNKYKLLKEFSIVKSDGQLFRLYNLSNLQDKNFTIKASLEHITKDINADFIEDSRAVDTTVYDALSKIVLDNRFTISPTDKTNTNTAYFIKDKPLTALFKTILTRWGGELKRDNFNIGIFNRIGRDTGISIEYSKNIIGFEQTLDYSNIVTKMRPTGKDGCTIDLVNNGSKWLESPRINQYFKVFSSEVKFEEIDDATTLKNKALELWGIIDIPKVNYKVNFVELQNIEGYKKLYKGMESLNIGDSIIIKHKVFNVNLNARVIRRTKDGLTGKILEIELGQFRDNIFNKFNDIDYKIEDTVTNLEETKKEFETKVIQTDEKISLEATRLDGEIELVRSQLEITAGQIRTEVSDTQNQLESIIAQTAGQIRTEVSDTQNQLESIIAQTAVDIRAEVSDTQNNLQSQINVQAGQISSKVSGSDYNGMTIASMINQTSKSINASALNIDLTGFVTFNSLSTPGATTIHGANLTTGTVVADRVEASTVNITGGQTIFEPYSKYMSSAPVELRFNHYQYGVNTDYGIMRYFGNSFFLTKSLYVQSALNCDSLYVGGTQITASSIIAKFG